jgi:hypothetical protein
MVPPERSLINFSEGKSSALIGVLDVGEVIVEVVKRCVATGGLDERNSHCVERRVHVSMVKVNLSRGRGLEAIGEVDG